MKLLTKFDRTAFRRLSVNLESKVGCLYFFENRSLITDLLPTKEDSKTLYNKDNKKCISYCYCNSNLLEIKQNKSNFIKKRLSNTVGNGYVVIDSTKRRSDLI